MHQNPNPHPTKHNGHRDHNDPLTIWQSFQEPMLRWADIPGSDAFLQMRMLHPEDEQLFELHQDIEKIQMLNAMMSGNPFHGNAPPAGVLPLLEKGRIPIAAIPTTGDVLSISLDDVLKNVLVVGPTGGGKTNWLRAAIASILESM